MRIPSLLVLAIALALVQSQPVATQPFGPLSPPILNGCTENQLFAVLNSPRGNDCLRNGLPRNANVPSNFSVFCSAGRWGCCVKTAGYVPGGCKYEGVIPVWRRPPPPATQD